MGVGLSAVAVAGAGAPEPSSTPKALPGASGKKASAKKANAKKAKAQPRSTTKRNSSGGQPRRPATVDAVKVPTLGHPTLQLTPVKTRGPTLTGWAAAGVAAPFADRRQRRWPMPVPNEFGDTLKIGERFAFDVTFAGNPAGQVVAKVAAVESDPRGAYPLGSDLVRIEGRVVSTGVVSMLSTVTADVATWLDRRTGASVRNEMVIKRSGLGAAYKKRVTTTEYNGRGRAEIIDVIDGKVRKYLRNLPADTLDDLSIMAWVRSLSLAKDERAVAHVLDGKVLMRMEVVGRGQQTLDPMPGIVTALGVAPADIRLLEGTLTRVDEFDVPLPGKRVYNFRAWVTADDRRLVLRLESDMWLGVVRLSLAAYDPPDVRD